jgi:hypothetical protein
VGLPDESDERCSNDAPGAASYRLSTRGAIVNASSLNGRIPAVEAPDYSAMKAALSGISSLWPSNLTDS